VRWYEIVSILFDLRGIVRTSWDYWGGFGIFNTDKGGSFESNLNTAVLTAMGFTPPEQKPPQKIREGITIFDNYPSGITSMNHWSSELNMYYPAGDKYVLAWSNPSQYAAITFDFKRNIDWEYLYSQDYAISFKIKTNNPARFDVRFVEREDIKNIPWRIRKTVDVEADGNWHDVRIPFSSMREHGAWVSADEKWLNPEGKFSWANIASFVLSAEEPTLTNVTLLFDAIKIEK
jgi:endoglucanase